VVILFRISIDRKDFFHVFLNRVFIIEKLLSIDAIPTGSDIQTLAKVCKLGNIGLSVSFVERSYNCGDMSSLGCLAM